MMELQDLTLAGETQLVVVVKLQEIDKHFVELMVVKELLEADTVGNEKVLRKIVNVVERDNTVEQLVITIVDSELFVRFCEVLIGLEAKLQVSFIAPFLVFYWGENDAMVEIIPTDLWHAPLLSDQLEWNLWHAPWLSDQLEWNLWPKYKFQL
ncbi:hypothetical protein Tco_1009312, partial [Tanacetum coccineum]